MSEKTTLLPTAPADFAPGSTGPQGSATGGGSQQEHAAIPMPRVVIVPGLEFDPARKYRYGMHALTAGVLVLISLILVELRDCSWGPGIDLDRLQALHISLAIFAFVLYLMSLFGIADFIFQYKIFFLIGVLLVYAVGILMIWMTYEAAVNPCVKTFNFAPIDTAFAANKNVFSRGDGLGIIVLLLDGIATLSMLSAATNFYKRY